jgi:dipeptide/tripeptide permease
MSFERKRKKMSEQTCFQRFKSMFDWLQILRSPTVVAVFILELAERSAYYGTVFSISTFATLMLKIDTNAAFIITNWVFALAPLSAFAAGILADTWFHRIEILIVAAVTYAVALLLLALSASPSFFGDGLFAEPTALPFLLYFPGLILLALGYGSFKVCTAPMVAEGVLSLAKKEMKFIVSGVENTKTLSSAENKSSSRNSQNHQQQYQAVNDSISTSNKNNTNDDTSGRNSSANSVSAPQKEQSDMSKNYVEDDDVEDEFVGSQETIDEDDLRSGGGDEEKGKENDVATVSPREAEQQQEADAETLKNPRSSGKDRSQVSFAKTPDEKEKSTTVEIVTESGSEKKEVDKDTLLAQTYSIYAAVINLGSLIGFSAIPSLRNVSDKQYLTGTYADDGKFRPAGFYYAWMVCFGMAICALIIFILMAKFSRRFVRPRGFAASCIQNQHSFTASAIDYGNHNDAKSSAKGSASGVVGGRTAMNAPTTVEHPMERLAVLAEAVGLGCLVNHCCSEYSTNPLPLSHDPSDKQNRVDEAKEDVASSFIGDPLIENREIVKQKKTKKKVHSLVVVLKLFFLLPIYWFTTQMTSSSYQIQAYCAALPDWLTVDMLNTANTVAFLVCLPIVQFFTSILLQRLHKNGSLFFGMFKSVLVLRLVVGFIISAIAMLCAGFLQVKIESVATLTADGDCILHNQDAIRDNVLPGPWASCLSFILSGVASAFTDPAALEAAFELAPADMRSTVMSIYLLESSLSGFVGLALSPAFASPSTFTASFFSMAVILTVITIVWAFWIRDCHQQTAPAALAAKVLAEQHKKIDEQETEEPKRALLAEA